MKPLAALLLPVIAPAICAAGARDARPSEGAPAAAQRLTPAGVDALRPAWSPDGRRIAYVVTPGEGTPGPEGGEGGAEEDSLRLIGREIRELDLASGRSRLRVAPADLLRAGLAAPRYDLLDLAWSPAGGRLAFTWSDGESWAQVAISEPDGRITVLPSPLLTDPWEGGAPYELSASQFLWDVGGESGTFVGWDEDCGSLYRARVPRRPDGPATAPAPLPLPAGCRPFFASTPGFWLFTEFDEEFSQRLGIVDVEGREVDAITFPQGRPIRVRWAPWLGGRAGPARRAGRPAAPPTRPAIAGWWYDADGRERILVTWSPGSLASWLSQTCPDDCADPVAVVNGGILFLDGPPKSARLVLVARPGAPLLDALAAPVEEVVAAPDGRAALAVRREGDRRSIWLIEGDRAPRRSGGRRRGRARSLWPAPRRLVYSDRTFYPANRRHRCPTAS